RVEPPCAYVARCGGCNWMHIARDSQPKFHAAIVENVVPDVWKSVPVVAHPSPGGSRTRARIHVRVHRGHVAVGFFEARSHDPVEVDTCLALHPSLDRARAALKPLFEKAKGDGDAELALGKVEDDAIRKPVLDLKWNGELPPTFYAALEKAVNAGVFQGARVLVGESRSPAVVGDPTPWIPGADGAPLELAPGGFAQASETGNVLLAKRVAELAKIALEGKEKPTLVELYAGAGNFTVLLATLGAKVTAVESHAGACAASQKNLVARGLAAKVTVGDAATYAIPNGTTLVVLDPPRTGAKEACETLVRAKAKKVVYVSCDPATFGRDLGILERGGYTLDSIETFEMFPDTAHVETVALLTRTK
ncbi:MAG TPA: class I SAM-dependent RNA methyltransferase, partial [Polyangiaceae bacterium]